MGIKELKKYLRANGFDGLYVPDTCACMGDDLLSCCETIEECKPGHIKKKDEEGYTIGGDGYIEIID